jgi:SAM-dependent methyltransferase
MSFSVPSDAYDRFVGRYSRGLAPRFADFAGVAGGPVLEVGCGPGALTAVLAERHGPASVAAVDPSESFVAACRVRVPGADVRLGTAEELPFEDRTFHGALSQLVLSFVRDPDRVVAETRRVVRPGGVVAACTFEADGFPVARTFWQAALRLDAAAPDDAHLPFRRLSELVALWDRAGLADVTTTIIGLEVRYEDFEDLWSPLSFGVGPPGAWLVGLPEPVRAKLRDVYFELLGRPAGAFSLTAKALAIRGRA